MPRSGEPPDGKGRGSTTTRSRVRQFGQQILPSSMGLEPTTVWGYGSVDHPGTFNYPAFTIEASWRRPVRVKWINELVEAERRVPAPPAADRPDAPLGQPARRRARSRRARQRPRALPRAGADRHPPARRAQQRGERRLPRGVVPARRRATSRPGYARTGSLLPDVPGAGPARARPGVDARQRGLPVRQRPARRRRCGTTTTPSA